MSVPLLNENICRCPTPSLEDAYAAMICIFERRRDFSAVFAFNDNMAFGVIKALISLGIRIPDDIAVMGFDDNAFADICLVPLTTMHQESYNLGKRAAEILFDKIEGRYKSLIHESLKPWIVERSSV